MLHLSDIDTKLPSDIGDELMGSGRGGDGGETMMTSLIVRINIAKLAEQIVSSLLPLGNSAMNVLTLFLPSQSDEVFG